MFHDPAMDALIDFSSQNGIYQRAKKKKGKTTQPFDWAAETKKDDPVDNGGGDGGDGGGPNGGDNAGGAGGGDDGDKDKKSDKDKKDKGKDKKEDDEAQNPDEVWSDFESAGKKLKKKGKKDLEPEPAKPDVFQDIKIDEPRPSLDHSVGTNESKTNAKASPFSGWGSSWTSGLFGAIKSATPVVGSPEKEETGSNSWGKARNGTAGLDLDGIDGLEDPPEPKKDDDNLGLAKKDKKKKKTSIWDEIESTKTKEPEPVPEPAPMADDIWGTTATKKKVRPSFIFTTHGIVEEKVVSTGWLMLRVLHAREAYFAGSANRITIEQEG